jgi:glycosyltransferase involved in cell wall biosynthesis
MKTQHPLLSLCIPSYNRAVWLEYALTIALEQAKEFNGLAEIVVSDNASEDNTLLVIEKLKKDYGDLLCVHRNERNIGLVNNCKKITEIAQGRYCWLIGNDDILKPNALKTAIKCLQENPHIDYFFCNYDYFYPMKTPEETTWINISRPSISSDQNNYTVEKIRDLVFADFNVFTPIYAFILNRERWLQLMKNQPTDATPFSSLKTYVPWAVYIIDYMLDEPGFYIGTPMLSASNFISWKQHLPYYVLQCLPSLYDKLEENGVPNDVLKHHREKISDCSAQSFLFFLTHPWSKAKKDFSLRNYFSKNWKTLFFWKLLLKTCIEGIKALFYRFLKAVHWANFYDLKTFIRKIISDKHYESLKK